MEALQEYPFPIMNPSLSTSNRNPAHRPPLIKAYATIGLAATSPATSPMRKMALNESRPGFCFAKEESIRPTPSPRPLDPQATSYFPVSSEVKRAPLQVQPNQGAGRRFRRNPNLYDKGALFRVLEEWYVTLDLLDHVLAGLKGKNPKLKQLRDLLEEVKIRSAGDLSVIYDTLHDYYENPTRLLLVRFDQDRLNALRAIINSLNPVINAFSIVKVSYGKALLGILEPHPPPPHHSEIQAEDILRQPANLGSAIYMEWDMFELDCAWDIAFEAFLNELKSTQATLRLGLLCDIESNRPAYIDGWGFGDVDEQMWLRGTSLPEIRGFVRRSVTPA